MKVKLTAELKKNASAQELPLINNVIKAMENNNTTTKEYAEMAARIACGCVNIKVLKSSAKVAYNWLERDALAVDTGMFDVWVDYVAFNGYEFIVGGAYVSDLQGCTSDNRATVLHRMCVRRYTKKR